MLLLLVFVFFVLHIFLFCFLSRVEITVKYNLYPAFLCSTFMVMR